METPSATGSLAAALERDHREIDEGIAAFEQAGDRASLARAIGALRRHIYLEEEVLFPPLHEAGLVAPIFVMLREHAQIWESLDSLERELATSDSATDAALMMCHRLVVLLEHHNMKEERVVYPPADDVLTADAAARLRTLLDAGDVPAQWVPLQMRR
jgi:hemerythrin-like domain-containing protein